jgi:tetratricopeptide (TPR) repeat protein
MKKRDRLIKMDNVILFPDYDKRLMEKGLDRLHEKKYREAIELLSEAKSFNPDGEDIYVGLVLAYFESGNLVEANRLAKEMLQAGIGEYFHIVDMYIMILVQQHQYEEIVLTIEALLEEREVPSEKLDHFMKMLQFSRKMVQEKPEFPEPIPSEQVEEELEFDLFDFFDQGDQVQIAGKLANHNARYYIEEISNYIACEKGDPFFKTMLLNVLKDQDYDKEIIVEKFERHLTIIPNQLYDVQLHPDLLCITEQVTEVLENNNPILLDSIKQLMERYFFLLYPFRTEIDLPRAWAAAFHFVTLAYFGQEEKLDKIAEMYRAEEKNVSEAISLISRIEEISYP